MSEQIQVSKSMWICKDHNKFYADGSCCPRCNINSDDRNLLIRKLSDQGKTQREIAKDLGIDQKQVWRIIKRFDQGPMSERFHAYSIKFNALVDYDHIRHEEKRMKQTVYKIFYSDNFICKVFHRSILISFRKEKNIYDMKCKVANDHALNLVLDFVKTLPSDIKVLDNVRDVVARHNAFVNDLIARKLSDQGKTLKVVIDGRTRALSDHSKGPAETEFVDKDYCIDDSSKYENFLADLIEKPCDLPSVLTTKTNIFFNAMENFSLNMNRHVSVMENIDQKLGRLDDVIDNQNKIVSSLVHNIGTSRLGVVPRSTEGSIKPRRSLGVKTPSVHRYRSERLRS